MADATVRVHGLVELNRAIKKADRETQDKLKEPFRRIGEIVRAEAQERFSTIDSRSASTFKVKTLVKGVRVEQSRRKTTGLRGDFGALQMRRALLPALDAKQPEVIRELEGGLEEIADIIRRA